MRGSCTLGHCASGQAEHTGLSYFTRSTSIIALTSEPRSRHQSFFPPDNTLNAFLALARSTVPGAW